MGAKQSSSDVTDASLGVDSTPLDLDDLYDVLKELSPISAKWNSIGIALRLKSDTLEVIQAGNIGDPRSCLTSVVKEWLKRNYDVRKFGEPTWRWLVEAVSSPTGGANMALARDMARKHKAGGMTFYSYQAHSGTHELSKTETFARENRQAIMTKFADFQTNVCDKLFCIGIDIKQFRLFVITQFPPGDCIPPLPTSLTEIFEAITHHGLWDYFHYSPLVRIAEKFGRGDSEIKGWVQTYKKDLKAYSLVTTVEEYIEADLEIVDPPAKRAKYDPRYYHPVEWKTEFIDHSLHYLAEVWELFSHHYLIPDSPPTALLDRVRRGCFSVTWLVSSRLIPTLIKRVKIDTDFFRQHRILRVTVGNKCVYEEGTEKSTLLSGLDCPPSVTSSYSQLSLQQVRGSNMQEERYSTDIVTSIGDVRKTSNGCEVARRIPRKKSGFRVHSGNIAAIDFGTTNCSVAYTTARSTPEEEPRRLPLNTTYYRVPTAILFEPDGSINSFGYDARAEYLNLDDEERLEYAYFEQIKMTLQHDENVSREMKIPAKNGKEYYLVDVIAQILKYLKIELIEKHLKRGGHPLEATDFDWVITVPAIWRARGKQMMREAGYKAGLCSKYSCGKLKLASGQWVPVIPEESSPDKLSLALEPEAAAIYCQNITAKQIAPYCESVPSFTSKSFLVVDIGGGTVDISAYRISSTPEQHIEVILPPAGNDCGGSMVNKKFAEFLGELVGDKTFSQYIDTGDETVKATNRTRLNELINDTFERQKRIFGEKGGEGRKVSIRLPYTFMEHYRSKLLEGIWKLEDSRIELSGIDLRFAYAKIEEFFQPVVEGLLQCITETLLSLDEEIETIYLVGGFGGCQYIYNAITNEFGNSYKYITPIEHDFAVVRGAVLFRQNPYIVHARRADATYGVRVNIPFQEGKHEEDYKWVNERGEAQCENIFSTIVERGDIIPTSEVIITEYVPSSLHQQQMHFDIYSSLEKDVWYTTGRRPTGTDLADVQKIGELIVPFLKDNTEDGAQGADKQSITNLERKVEVTFDFSHTEIQVKGYDKLSNTEVKVVLDFLSL